jgi:protease-4
MWLLLAGGAFSVFLVAMIALLLAVSPPAGGSDFGFQERIQVVDIEGVLVDSRDLIDQLQRYEDVSSVPAILLHIDSPGGDVATSQELYAQVLRLKEKGKTVVAYFSSTGASGAYYVACAADLIIANPGTVVGSIGVIAEWLNYSELLEWARLSSVVLKSGEFKDTGSSTRDLTEDERAYFQSLIDDMYAQFVDAVASGRGLDVNQVRQFADGRVFTGRAAVELDMIDHTGNFQDAVERTAELAGITGMPRLIEVERPTLTLLDIISGGLSGSLPFFGEAGTTEQIRFQYLWK